MILHRLQFLKGNGDCGLAVALNVAFGGEDDL
jgi:hypothetical protein